MDKMAIRLLVGIELNVTENSTLANGWDLETGFEPEIGFVLCRRADGTKGYNLMYWRGG